VCTLEALAYRLFSCLLAHFLKSLGKLGMGRSFLLAFERVHLIDFAAQPRHPPHLAAVALAHGDLEFLAVFLPPSKHELMHRRARMPPALLTIVMPPLPLLLSGPHRTTAGTHSRRRRPAPFPVQNSSRNVKTSAPLFAIPD
jgi:hypothetical protein